MSTAAIACNAFATAFFLARRCYRTVIGRADVLEPDGKFDNIER